jgi:hypothetical protein
MRNHPIAASIGLVVLVSIIVGSHYHSRAPQPVTWAGYEIRPASSTTA